MKKCNKCGLEKPATAEYFSKANNVKSGIGGRCLTCINLKGKKYYKENRDSVLEKSKKYEASAERMVSRKLYIEANKERTAIVARMYIKNNQHIRRGYAQKRSARKRKLPHTFTFKQWENVKQHFNNKCAYCGEEKELEQEHFYPLSLGGEYTINNIIPACKMCNSSKGNKEFLEWYPAYKCYSTKRESFILKFLDYNNHRQQLTLAI